jgi:hypothetical protein
LLISSKHEDFELKHERLSKKIKDVLTTISYREREVTKLRYGLGDGYSYTLEEVGHLFKVTRERIRMIEAKSTRKLQQPSRSQELVGFLEKGRPGDHLLNKIETESKLDNHIAHRKFDIIKFKNIFYSLLTDESGNVNYRMLYFYDVPAARQMFTTDSLELNDLHELLDEQVNADLQDYIFDYFGQERKEEFRKATELLREFILNDGSATGRIVANSRVDNKYYDQF